MRSIAAAILTAGLIAASVAPFDARAAEPTGLRVATFCCDVTPPLGQPIYSSYRPLARIEHPLLAKGIVLEDPTRRYVICAVDYCEICNSTRLMFCEKLAEAAGTEPQYVAVQTVHQHTAPMACGDAYALAAATDRPPACPHPKAFDSIAEKLAAAAKAARGRLQPFDRVGYGRAKVERVASSRRVPAGEGKVRVRWSACKDPELRAEPEGKIDPWLRTVTLADCNGPLVHMHYYAVHPQSFYGDPRASYDFPGIARQRLEKESGAFQVYFTGCAGDVTAGKYNDGSPQARDELAERLYDGMKAAVAATRFAAAKELAWRTLPLQLPLRSDPGHTVEDCRARMNDPQAAGLARIFRGAMPVAFADRQRRPLAISMLQIGKVCVVHLPGECMIDFQLFAQGRRPDALVAVAAYGDCGPGYICTDQAFAEGGYEPTASRVAPGSEKRLKDAIARLLDR